MRFCQLKFDDKLSAKCNYALFDAADQLERAVPALNNAANEFDADLGGLCDSHFQGQPVLTEISYSV